MRIREIVPKKAFIIWSGKKEKPNAAIIAKTDHDPYKYEISSNRSFIHPSYHMKVLNLTVDGYIIRVSFSLKHKYFLNTHNP